MNRNVATFVLLAVALCASQLPAQNACTKDEIFGGYAALITNGWGDLFYKVNTIPNAFDASNTFYLPGAHNFGLLMDGSGHFKGSTTPPNQENGSNDSTGVGYVLGRRAVQMAQREGLSIPASNGWRCEHFAGLLPRQ